MVRDCLDLAEYAVHKLKANGIDAWRHANSVTVVFPRPPAAVMQKWIIALKNDIGHITVMAHVSTAIIDEFVADFAAALQQEPRIQNRESTSR